ncbi:MAG TPA: AsnC family protein [Rhodoglobus sp.]|nr:AsnC family protein [Rhodoglobus sp.]
MGDEVAGGDRSRAGLERDARARLAGIADGAKRGTGVRAGAPSAIDLLLAHARSVDLDEGERAELATAALHLVPAAQAELESAEIAAMSAARDARLSWRRIADALGLQSPQAAQQRWERLRGRAGSRIVR